MSYKTERRKVCVYIETILAETCGWGIDGGVRLAMVHGRC